MTLRVGRVPFGLSSHARDALAAHARESRRSRSAFARRSRRWRRSWRVRCFAWPGARWASIAGFSAVVIDKGGAYRTRALAMSALTIGSALALMLSGLTDHRGGARRSLMLVFAGVGGLLRVLGPEMASVGTSSAVMLALAIDAHLSPLDALHHAPFVLIGGAWAMLVSLIFWPIRVHRPGRIAVARCFDELGDHARHMHDLLVRADDDAWQSMLQRDHGQLRVTLEAARNVLGATRRGNRGESGRGARLLALFSAVDQIFVALVASATWSTMKNEDRARTATAQLKTLPRSSPRWRPTFATKTRSRRRKTPATSGSIPKINIDAIFSRMSRWLDLSRDVVVTLHDDAPLPAEDPALADATRATFVHRGAPLDELRAALSWQSAIARHAARLGISAAIAIATTRALNLQRGYWVTLTVIIVLQPFTPETLKKGRAAHRRNDRGRRARIGGRVFRSRSDRAVRRRNAARGSQRCSPSIELCALRFFSDADFRAARGSQRRRFSSREIANAEHHHRRRDRISRGAYFLAVLGAPEDFRARWRSRFARRAFSSMHRSHLRSTLHASMQRDAISE